MGKCVICGRKAKNSYKFYIGNVKDKKVDSDGFGGRTITVQYDNITEHNEYLCKKCSYDDLSLWLAGFTICLFLLLIMVIFLYIPQPKSVQSTWPFAALLLFGAFLCIVRSKILSYLKDDKIDETEAAVILILMHKERTKDDAPLLYDKYLTPALFRELKPTQYKKISPHDQ